MSTESVALPGRPVSNEDLRDLGFGSVVSRESHKRLLNRDGSFNVSRKGLSFWTSLSVYHAMLAITWPRFFALLAAFYLGINTIFATAYVASGPGALAGDSSLAAHPFLRAFFFSVETLSTIGYGHIVPSGLAANVVMTFESVLGLLGFAIITGLLFARFSRPTAKILFSKVAVIAPYGAGRAFEFRIINARSSQLIDMEARVMLTRFEDIDGVRTRKYYLLPLERSRVAFFPLAWTVVHPIDESSPLFNETAESLRAAHGEFLVLLTATDETFSQVVNTRSSYAMSEVVWEAKFASMFGAPASDGSVAVDIEKLHAFERLQLEA